MRDLQGLTDYPGPNAPLVLRWLVFSLHPSLPAVSLLNQPRFMFRYKPHEAKLSYIVSLGTLLGSNKSRKVCKENHGPINESGTWSFKLRKLRSATLSEDVLLSLWVLMFLEYFFTFVICWTACWSKCFKNKTGLGHFNISTLFTKEETAFAGTEPLCSQSWLDGECFRKECIF